MCLRWGFQGERGIGARDKGPKDRPILWTPKLADPRSPIRANSPSSYSLRGNLHPASEHCDDRLGCDSLSLSFSLPLYLSIYVSLSLSLSTCFFASFASATNRRLFARMNFQRDDKRHCVDAEFIPIGGRTRSTVARYRRTATSRSYDATNRINGERQFIRENRESNE